VREVREERKEGRKEGERERALPEDSETAGRGVVESGQGELGQCMEEGVEC
jgi:hypothetical protein